MQKSLTINLRDADGRTLVNTWYDCPATPSIGHKVQATPKFTGEVVEVVWEEADRVSVYLK